MKLRLGECECGICGGQIYAGEKVVAVAQGQKWVDGSQTLSPREDVFRRVHWRCWIGRFGSHYEWHRGHDVCRSCGQSILGAHAVQVELGTQEQAPHSTMEGRSVLAVFHDDGQCFRASWRRGFDAARPRPRLRAA